MSSMSLSARTIDSFGVDRFVIAQFLIKGESEPIPFTFKVNGIPVDVTNYTLTFRLQKQLVDTAKDTKNGFDCLGRRPDTTVPEFNLDSFFTKTDAVNGKMLWEIPTTVTAIGENEFGLPAVYSGYATMEDNASQGELIRKIPFLVVVK